MKPRRLQKPIRDTPTVAEFELLLADVRAQRRNADARWSGDFLEWIGRAGMGRAEVAALTWADVGPGARADAHLDLLRGCGPGGVPGDRVFSPG